MNQLNKVVSLSMILLLGVWVSHGEALRIVEPKAGTVVKTGETFTFVVELGPEDSWVRFINYPGCDDCLDHPITDTTRPLQIKHTPTVPLETDLGENFLTVGISDGDLDNGRLENTEIPLIVISGTPPVEIVQEPLAEFDRIGGVDVSLTPEEIRYGDGVVREHPKSEFRYTSSDPEVVAIGPMGDWQALKEGSATVTIRHKPSGLEKEVPVTVKVHPLARITLKHKPPVAVIAPATLTVKSGEKVTLDGQGSFDPEGMPFRYEWVWRGGPSFDINNGPTVTFTAPDVSQPEEVVITLQLHKYLPDNRHQMSSLRAVSRIRVEP